jgi:hypothetical protein
MISDAQILLRPKLNADIKFPQSKFTIENNVNESIFVTYVTREEKKACKISEKFSSVKVKGNAFKFPSLLTVLEIIALHC